MMRWTTLLWAALASVTMAAQEDPVVKTIAPYVGEQTIAVVHIDAAGVDLARAKETALDLMKQLKPAEAEMAEATNQISGAAEAGAVWLRQFRAAGGRHLFLVTALTDPPLSPGVLIAPVEKPGDAESLAKFLREFDPARVHVRDDAVLLADKAVIDRATAQGGKARPEFFEAIAAVADHPVRGVFAPTADMRRVVETMAPNLPKELGGGPSTTLTRGVRWVAVGAQAGQRLSGTLIIQSPDETSAKALDGMLRAGLENLAAALKLKDQLAKAAELVLPRQQASRLTLTIDQDQLTTLAQLSAEPMSMARERAKRVQSMSNMRQVLLGIIMHADANKGQWPEDLQALVKTGHIPPQVLTNPRQPAGRGYIYVKPTVPFGKTGPDHILLHESIDDAGDGISVGFADGHVEWMTVERFKETMAKQKAGGK